LGLYVPASRNRFMILLRAPKRLAQDVSQFEGCRYRSLAAARSKVFEIGTLTGCEICVEFEVLLSKIELLMRLRSLRTRRRVKCPWRYRGLPEREQAIRRAMGGGDPWETSEPSPSSITKQLLPGEPGTFEHHSLLLQALKQVYTLTSQ